MPYPTLPGMPPGATITGSVNYDIEKVEWNVYEFTDGVTICFLQLPVTVYSTNRVQNGVPLYLIFWNNSVRAVVSQNEMGKPAAEPLTPQQLATAAYDIVTPLTASEPWNVFNLRDGYILRSRSVSTQIRKLRDCYDNFGNPVYSVGAQTVIDIQNPPREIRQRQQSI